MKDFKYMAAYSIPLACVVGLILKGPWSFFAPFFAFILIPALEMLFPVDALNLSEQDAATKAKNKLFDLFLYLNIPLVFSISGYFLHSLSSSNYQTYELIGLTFSVGIVVGSNGINVAHELGHRDSRWEKSLAKLLLLPSLYMHFYIEHNFGHHKNAATAEDPASAKYNQSVYRFWVTSISYQYINAWRIQKELLRRASKPFFSVKNDMLWYTLFELVYLLAVYLMFGLIGLVVALGIALSAAILLETINYIEHYGLSRSKLPSGRYERVKQVHSWNSNHVLGRIMLYELTRHSDHHYKANKKYQLLDCHKESPQMPYGYPTSMLLALFPPLWFRIMNRRIPVEMRP